MKASTVAGGVAGSLGGLLSKYLQTKFRWSDLLTTSQGGRGT
jgi:hypothetical protein